MGAVVESTHGSFGAIGGDEAKRQKRLVRAGALGVAVSLHVVAAYLLVLEFRKSAEPKWMDGGGEAVDVVGVSLAEAGTSEGARQNRDQPKDELKALLSAQSASGDSVSKSSHKSPSTSLDELLGAPADNTASRTEAAGRTASPAGSAKRMTALKPGESLSKVDVFEAGSLPRVGAPPKTPLDDLWRQVQSCWRPISGDRAELTVELESGRLAGQPMAIHAGPASPSATLAERAAVRAIEACAPYGPQFSGRWRIVFPAVGRGAS